MFNKYSNIKYEVDNDVSAAWSFGVTISEIEKTEYLYFRNKLKTDELDEWIYWVVLAAVEWKYGCLQPDTLIRAVESAKCIMETEHFNDVSNEELRNIKKKTAVIDEQIKTVNVWPAKKKRFASRQTEWPAGALFRYCLNLDDSDKKYVLIRVIMRAKMVHSLRFADICWTDYPLLGVYNWIGNQVPEKEEIEQLKFATLEKRQVLSSDLAIKRVKNKLEDGGKEMVDHVVRMLKTTEITNCVWPVFYKREYKELFQLIDIDEKYETRLPDFFLENGIHYCLSTRKPFDNMVKKLFSGAEKNRLLL